MITKELVEKKARTGQSDVETKSYISKEQYWEQYYEHPDVSYEWNNGYLEEKPVASVIEFAMYLWFIKILEQYLEQHPIAQTIGLETGFEMVLPHKTTIRKPDLGVVLHSNPTSLRERDRRYYGIFDICIESVSASSKAEIERDTVDKFSEYQLAGVQEYYILDERGLETVFLQNQQGIYQPLPIIEDVVHSQVLPGFQFRLEDLARRPKLIDLTTDVVYQNYILPEYQQERQAKQLAQQRAEQERQAKEKLAAKLRELGIDPDSIT